jgi:hypothetical protein
MASVKLVQPKETFTVPALPKITKESSCQTNPVLTAAWSRDNDNYDRVETVRRVVFTLKN